jgi:hypothetical protein
LAGTPWHSARCKRHSGTPVDADGGLVEPAKAKPKFKESRIIAEQHFYALRTISIQ